MFLAEFFVVKKQMKAAKLGRSIKLGGNLQQAMVINEIEGKTTCLYRKWVWLGVELGHRDLISAFHSSCVFFCVSVRIGVQVVAILQEIVTLKKKKKKKISVHFLRTLAQ